MSDEEIKEYLSKISEKLDLSDKRRIRKLIILGITYEKMLKKESVLYTTCNTEWGLDARYVCPKCERPVEKDHKFCPNCGKALNWFNAPHATQETRNRFLAYAKNGIKVVMRSTSSDWYGINSNRREVHELLY